METGDNEEKLFLGFATVMKDLDEEIDIQDVLCAIARMAALIVSQAPDENMRESIGSFVVNAYHMYMHDNLTHGGKPLTKQEDRNYRAAKAALETSDGNIQ